jgi:hypothetical protein
VNGSDETPGSEPVGSAGEEAAKLLGALADWARDHGADVGAAMGSLAGYAAGAAHEVDMHLATGAEECRYCPVCRFIHLMRTTPPEVRGHLTMAASSLAQAAAALLATAVPEQRATSVEHIDLAEGDWPEEADGGTSPDGNSDGEDE